MTRQIFCLGRVISWWKISRCHFDTTITWYPCVPTTIPLLHPPHPVTENSASKKTSRLFFVMFGVNPDTVTLRDSRVIVMIKKTPRYCCLVPMYRVIINTKTTPTHRLSIKTYLNHFFLHFVTFFVYINQYPLILCTCNCCRLSPQITPQFCDFLYPPYM